MRYFWVARVALLGVLAYPYISVEAVATGQSVETVGQSPDAASGTPAVVFLMRHAEKPVGDDKNSDLTTQGFKRASLLPSLFLAGREPARLPRPDALFATDRSKHSNRPIETITPLSQALHLPINHDYEDHDTASIARKILSGAYASKVVVVCWHHGELPHLARALGVEAPPTWSDTTFDQIWKVEWVNGTARLTAIPELLLPGDSTHS